jgi:hypothetical protein
MADRGFNVPCEPLSAARKTATDKQFHPGLAADGFDIWWQKISAKHIAMTAEASALMRAHRRVSLAGQARVGQTH